MRALSADELLDVWERGTHVSWERRAALLVATSPDAAPAASDLSIGERDARLLRLRELTFGSEMKCLVACPACGDSVEMRFAVDDVRVDTPSSRSPQTLTLSQDGWDVEFRLPTAGDLADLPDEPEVARRCLLDRCIVSGQGFPDTVLDAVIAKMAETDPQADVQLALQCPSCGYGWRATFDIVSFFWIEIHAWACRLLRDVHTLASAYGWRERDILSMSPFRRQWYLGMVGS